MPDVNDDRDAGNPQRKTEPTPASHSRPRPQYGEYATPQDQANAIATSLPPVSPVLLPPERTNPSRVGPISTPTHTATPAHSVAPPHDRSAPPPDPATRITAPNGSSRDIGDVTPTTAVPARRWDLVISLGLLVYGVLNVISGLFLYADMGAYLDEVFATLGIGQYTETGLERPIGIAIAASNVVSFALGAWFTVKRLRAGKVAFWIPLVAGAIATVVSAILLQVLVSNDPAMNAYITRLIGG